MAKKRSRRPSEQDRRSRKGTATLDELEGFEEALKEQQRKIGAVRADMGRLGIDEIEFDGADQFARGYRLVARAVNQFGKGVEDARTF